MLMKSFLLVLLSLLSSRAFAIFIPEQMEEIDREDQFDSEEFMDYLAFRFPKDWEERWRDSWQGFRTTVGSLDCCHFRIDQELKLRLPVTSRVAFRYNLLQQEDQDLEEFHQFLEFETRAVGPFYASVWGEPHFNKEEHDAGFALTYRKSIRRFLRLSYLYVDFDFNKRTNSANRYVDFPQTFRAEGEWHLPARWDLLFFFERDIPTLFNNAEEGLLYHYNRTQAKIDLRYDRFLKNILGGLLAYEHKREGEAFNTAELTVNDIDYQRNLWTVEGYYEREWGVWGKFTLGLQWIKRETDTEQPHSPQNENQFARTEWIPYLLYQKPWLSWLTPHLGYVFGNIARTREFPNNPASDFDSFEPEHKGIWMLEFHPKESLRLILNANWDLDEIVNHPWDGGNAMLQATF